MEPSSNAIAANGILSSLKPADMFTIGRHLVCVEMPYRMHIQEPNRVIPYAYFIVDGIASLIAVSQRSRRQAEAGLTGNEGMTGLAIVHGTDRSPCECTMQIAGHGLQISAAHLRSAMAQSETLRDACGRYAHVFGTQTEHTSLANADGTIPERLARWLLMMQDRLSGNDLPLTHELVSVMVGARRAGVTTALGGFSDNKLIRLSRGTITVLDRAALIIVAGGLYGVPEEEYRRLFH